MAEFLKVTHVIFDLDGTLLDTETIYNKGLATLASRYGKTYTIELRDMLSGTPLKDSARIFKNELHLPISESQMFQEMVETHTSNLKDIKLMPGAERLIRHLHKCDVPIAVATSSRTQSVDHKIENHKELFSLFHHIVSGASDPEVKNGKPAPDIFLVCASRFPDKPEPEKCLVFEDAPAGVLAARGADMQVIMIPQNDVSAEKKKPATLVLQSLSDFMPELFGLPPFNN